VRASAGITDGAFVVNEPIGVQGWFPSNNHPSDKAAFDFIVTVPTGKTAFGTGELVSNAANGDGTTTWHWREDDPTATYLTTATVGDFDFTTGQMTETATGHVLEIYEGIFSSASAAQKTATNEELDRIPAMTNFLGERLYGPYPFDSTGAVVDNVPALGYALEVQGKPHFPSALGPGSRSTVLHEVAHQWMGNHVSPATWADIWFNEGWATWSEWYWGNEANGVTTTPEQRFDSNYDSRPADDPDWGIAPAVLDNDPANLFALFPVYTRGAMTIQGYREIVGDPTFFRFSKRLNAEFAYGNITTRRFIEVAKEESGFTGARLQRLDDYFQQWLYGETKPTITPDTF
jgi:aminopeptidase N